MITNNLYRYWFQMICSRLLMIWLVMTLTFFIVHALPGNPIDRFVNDQIEKFGLTDQEARQRASIVFCFDLKTALDKQYFNYLGGVLRGDLGKSCAVSPNAPVSQLVLANLPWTLFSVGISLLISFVIGTCLGMFAAYQRNTHADHFITHASAVIDSIPASLTGVFFIFLVGVLLKLVPASEMRGALSPKIQPEFSFTFILDALKHYIWPGSIYILTAVGSWTLAMRSSTLSVLGDDYVMAARARGLPPLRILTAYIGRNASLPLFTRLGISLSFILGGSVLIEKIFVYRGIGDLLLRAIITRDYTLMQGIFLLMSVTVIVSTTLIDFLLGWLDPRVRARSFQEP